jgi:ATP-dependent RNA helicase UAP56/SUB2
MRASVQNIFMSSTNPNRQVMMFSATMDDETKNVCRLYMKDPFELFIDSDSKLTLHGLKQYYVKLEDSQKIQKLVELLDSLEFNQVIIFVSQTKYAQKLQDVINNEGFPSIASHSDMKQDQRIKIYNDFKEGKYRIMISTDLFGRGIDIEKINIVINFHMPDKADQYLHRVGRAGRFGTKGLTISFISNEQDIQVLSEVQSRFEVKVEELPSQIDKSTYMNN